jgi:hypothetical protein
VKASNSCVGTLISVLSFLLFSVKVFFHPFSLFFLTFYYLFSFYRIDFFIVLHFFPSFLILFYSCFFDSCDFISSLSNLFETKMLGCYCYCYCCCTQLRYFASLGRDVDAWRKCHQALPFFEHNIVHSKFIGPSEQIVWSVERRRGPYGRGSIDTSKSQIGKLISSPTNIIHNQSNYVSQISVKNYLIYVLPNGPTKDHGPIIFLDSGGEFFSQLLKWGQPGATIRN